MTSATGNRTTELLRKLLDERGVRWVEATPSKTKWYSPVLNGPVAVSEWNGKLVLDAGYVNVTPEQAIAATLGSEINGDTSDGYHTFNELYHHRAVLFSVIVRDHRELAWKARKHHDGTMYDGMFIVGIETPKGQATYHYDLDPYWEMFDCEEREYAPEWDGHTPDDAIARIAELGGGTCRLDETESYSNANEVIHLLECSKCGKTCEHVNGSYPRCPNCGRKLVRANGDQL